MFFNLHVCIYVSNASVATCIIVTSVYLSSTLEYRTKILCIIGIKFLYVKGSTLVQNPRHVCKLSSIVQCDGCANLAPLEATV